MITFIIAVALLIGGYVIYGSIVEQIFGADPCLETPAMKNPDGVDYMPIDGIKAFLIQLLNIAGVGPIFGAIAGALWGPVVYLWIVFGCIFAGAVHDYLSGMLSVRNNGKTVGDVVGKYLGSTAKIFMRMFSVLVLMLIGVIFISSPGSIMQNLTGIPLNFWIALTILYYIIATVMPINKIVARLYPVFGAALLVMCFGIGGGLFFLDQPMPELSLENMHPRGLPIFPFMFISVACGAISGFHATQSPLMARCIQNESQGRKVFYGAMISEGFIALIWAAAGVTFFGGSEGLLAAGPAPVVVSIISQEMLGPIGGILAIIGVVVCPITSGDTAFRSVRLTIADAFKLDQGPIKNRFIIAIPLFIVATFLCYADFATLWRYTSWVNQILAAFVLWAASVYLANEGKFYWIAVLPAMFMTVVATSYIIVAPEGLRMSSELGMACGVIVAILVLVLFMIKTKKSENALEN